MHVALLGAVLIHGIHPVAHHHCLRNLSERPPLRSARGRVRDGQKLDDVRAGSGTVGWSILAGMTDEERDELLLEIRDTLRDHGERLERIEKDHGSALRAHLEQLHAIRVVLTGDRAQHYQLAERVADLESKAG